MPPRRAVAALSLGVEVAAISAHALATAAFRRRIAVLATVLEGSASRKTGAVEVPAIVRSFARRAVPAGFVPDLIRLRQVAEMRLTPGGVWRSLTAEQVISIREPGFLWLARMHVAPLVSVRVLDAYVGGQGFLEARLLGSVRLARSAERVVSRGELMRYLAELAWAPHAMLDNPHLRWREVEPNMIEVSADSPGGPASVRFVFEHGDIVRVEADGRPRALGARFVSTPWQGRYVDYREVNGYRMPTRAEVNWVLETGPFVCWRGKITDYHIT